MSAARRWSPSRARPGDVSAPEEGSSGEHQAAFEIDDVIAEPASGAPVEREEQVGWRQAPKPGPGAAEPRGAAARERAEGGALGLRAKVMMRPRRRRWRCRRGGRVGGEAISGDGSR
jgi:hypothetical protein